MSTEVMRVAADKRPGMGRLVRNGLIAGVVVSILISASVWVLAAVIPGKTGSPIAPIRDLCQWIAGSRTFGATRAAPEWSVKAYRRPSA